jgi:hypothetical protein
MFVPNIERVTGICVHIFHATQRIKQASRTGGLHGSLPLVSLIIKLLLSGVVQNSKFMFKYLCGTL